jgi:hypothetical protein
MGFEVFTAVFMKSSILWDITSRSLLKINRRFGVKYYLQPTYTISLLLSLVLCPPHTRTTFLPVLPSLWMALFKPSHSPSDLYWFTIVLWESQWELTGWIPWSNLLYIIPRFRKPHAFFAAPLMLVSCSSILKMGAIFSSETFVDFQRVHHCSLFHSSSITVTIQSSFNLR